MKGAYPLWMENWITKQGQHGNIYEGSNQSSKTARRNMSKGTKMKTVQLDEDIEQPATLQFCEDDVLLVSDIGTNSVVAVKLVVYGFSFSVKAVVIGQICGFASVFGMTYGRGTIYVASSHPESGRILSFN